MQEVFYSWNFVKAMLFLVEIEKSGFSWDNPRIEKKALKKRATIKENAKKKNKLIGG